MSDKSTRIYSVLSLTAVDIIKTNPPALHVAADGLVETSQWSNPVLVPRTCEAKTPPADGIQEFDFHATPPTSDAIVLPYETKISGSGTLPDLPEWVRGVRVIADTNEVEYLFPIAEPLFSKAGKATQEIEGEAEFMARTASGASVEPIFAEEIDGELYPERAGKSCRSYTLGKVSIPEFKTEWKIKCILRDPFSGKCITKTKMPVLYRRTSKVMLIAQVCLPKDDTVWDAVKDCIEKAVIVGIAAGVILKGNLAPVTAVLKAFVISCLKAKLGDLANEVDVALRRHKIPGKWKKV